MGAMGAMMAMSSLSSIGSAYSNSQAIKASGDYQKEVADTNAQIANVESGQVLEAGDIAASRKNADTERSVGSAKTSYAASGVDLSSPTAKAVVSGISTTGSIDELTIRNNAARQAWGLKTQALEDTFAGKFAQLTSRAQSEQTLLTGGIQAVEGPTSIYANYNRWSRYMGSGAPVVDNKIS